VDISFDQIADGLANTGLMANPAEIHGMLCGRLSGGQQLDSNGCVAAVEELYDLDTNTLKPMYGDLIALHEESINKLQGTGFGFDLLLPDDEYEISQRLDSLAQWCQGFLVGLGLSGLASETQFSTDCADALRDLAEIAQVDSQEFDTEENEVSFFELTEYVRMAALLIASEANEVKPNHKPTLH